MILTFYIALNILGLLFFIRIRKSLHSLEVLVYWLTASYMFQNFSALCYMNFKTLIIPEKLSYEFAHFINRTMLYPMVMVTFLHYYLAVGTMLKKVLLLIGFTLSLTGLEWLADFLGVLDHVHWKLWWSFALWALSLLVLIIFMKFFRRLLYNGGSKS